MIYKPLKPLFSTTYTKVVEKYYQTVALNYFITLNTFTEKNHTHSSLQLPYQEEELPEL